MDVYSLDLTVIVKADSLEAADAMAAAFADIIDRQPGVVSVWRAGAELADRDVLRDLVV